MQPTKRKVDLHVYVSTKFRNALRSMIYIQERLEKKRITLSATVENVLSEAIPAFCLSLLSNHNHIPEEDRTILEKLVDEFSTI